MMTVLIMRVIITLIVIVTVLNIVLILGQYHVLKYKRKKYITAYKKYKNAFMAFLITLIGGN